MMFCLVNVIKNESRRERLQATKEHQIFLNEGFFNREFLSRNFIKNDADKTLPNTAPMHDPAQTSRKKCSPKYILEYAVQHASAKNKNAKRL